MKNIINVQFFGPYKLSKGDRVLFNENISINQGIYLWTVKYKDAYLIDYIGETSRTFHQRMREHLIELMGDNYRICDPEMLLQGQEVIIWNGLWRKGTKKEIVNFIEMFVDIAPIVKRYIEVHDIFLAPLSTDKATRRLIEGNITYAIKHANAPASNLLPLDIRYKKTCE